MIQKLAIRKTSKKRYFFSSPISRNSLSKLDQHILDRVGPLPMLQDWQIPNLQRSKSAEDELGRSKKGKDTAMRFSWRDSN